MGGGTTKVPSRPSAKRGHALDSNRFYCPYPGCTRSFAELWRLKVHYRAAPDVRGSGKERGHGSELKACPKCGAELKPGRHHVGCVAGRSVSRPKARKRSSKTSPSRTRGRVTEDDERDEDEEDCSYKSDEEFATRRRRSKRRIESASEPSSTQGQTIMGHPGGTAMGVPAQWVPMDFSLFGNPVDRPNNLAIPAAALRPTMDDSIFNLIYCNQGACPVMATAHMSQQSDLNSSLDFDFDLDFEGLFETKAAVKERPEDLKFGEDCLNLQVVQPGGDKAGGPQIKTQEKLRESGPVRDCSQDCLDLRDPLLAPFPTGLDDDDVFLGRDGLGGRSSDLDHDESDFLLSTGPIWEPLATPMKDLGQRHCKQAGNGTKDLLTDDRGLVPCPAPEMRGEDGISR
ncbi:hypothetical protein BSKO_01058 [Bryopsis sp. KO-2023]|nr:hypothetical protein BSKO_01058 [Bryopsis sp. KO-2023]